MKRALFAAGAAVALFMATTWLALESGGVALVTTETRAGAARETHVWFAEIAGELWLEAGAPDNPWLLDAQERPRIRIAFPNEAPRAFAANPVRSSAAQQRVRAALHAKYGWRDSWVGLFVDASRSVAVKLEPVA